MIVGSEIDDEEMIVSESENSNDSWTTEEFSSEFIMKYGSRLMDPHNYEFSIANILVLTYISFQLPNFPCDMLAHTLVCRA